MTIFKKYFIFIFITFFFNNISFSVTLSDSSTTTEEPRPPVKMSDYNLAKKYIKKADKYDNKNKKEKAKKYYTKAIKYLFKSNKKYQSNSDTFTYLGYTNAKLGEFETAEIYFLLALEVKPNHKILNEYLGRLYIHTNRLNEAKERLKVLESCNCDEFKRLNNAIKLGASKY